MRRSNTEVFAKRLLATNEARLYAVVPRVVAEQEVKRKAEQRRRLEEVGNRRRDKEAHLDYWDTPCKGHVTC